MECGHATAAAALVATLVAANKAWGDAASRDRCPAALVSLLGLQHALRAAGPLHAPAAEHQPPEVTRLQLPVAATIDALCSAFFLRSQLCSQ